MIKHKEIYLPDLQTESINGNRYYITPSGKKYPSITTVLGQSGNEHLVAWKKRLGDEADTISKYACDVGENYHKVIEEYVNNNEDYLSHGTPHSKYMFKAVRPFLDKINLVYCQEASLYSDILGIAGRTDCIGEYEGVPCIIDYKTSLRIKKEEWIQKYYLQTTAYSLMFEEMTGIAVKGIVIIMATYDSTPLIFKSQRHKHYAALKEVLRTNLPLLKL